MRSKILLWGLAVLVFGSLICLGILVREINEPLFYMMIGAAVLSAILFSVLYRQLMRPFQIMIGGTELLKQQDFSSRLRRVNNAEADKLIDIFNKMIVQLHEERLAVREKNQFLDLLINASPQGVIIMDYDERITDINPAGMDILGIKDISDVRGLKIVESGIRMSQNLSSLKQGEDLIVRDPGFAAYRCVRSSFIDRGFDRPFLLVEEMTEELHRIEKQSYENIIRMMSHEVNNSTGAVVATLDVVSEVLGEDGREETKDILPVVKASLERCVHLGRFVSNLAGVLKIPEPSLSDVSLNELARSVDAITNIECQKRGIKLVLDLTNDETTVKVDGIQIEQVLVNIVKNAYESIGSGGEIRVITSSSPASITVEDNGPGISEESRPKLFTPFYTTKPNGQGIGLMFIREVLMNHKARFNLYTAGGVTRFEIFF